MHIFQLKSNDMLYKIDPAWILLFSTKSSIDDFTNFQSLDASYSS